MLGWLLKKPIASGSANTLRCLPLESQLPLKPCFALQPFQFKGNCDSSDLLLDFCYSFSCSLICFANVGYSPTPRQHFCKTAAPKNFYLPAARSQQPYIYSPYKKEQDVPPCSSSCCICTYSIFPYNPTCKSSSGFGFR